MWLCVVRIQFTNRTDNCCTTSFYHELSMFSVFCVKQYMQKHYVQTAFPHPKVGVIAEAVFKISFVNVFFL